MTEIEQLFQCIICPAAYAKKQSLRAHMKVHKGEYMRTSIQADKEVWKQFDELCKDHKTTTCHVINVLLKGIVAGAAAGNIDLPKILSPNPVVINMTHIFLGKPRSKYKIDVSGIAAAQHGCRVCGSQVTREFQPKGTPFIEGECLKCGARWLVSPGGS